MCDASTLIILKLFFMYGLIIRAETHIRISLAFFFERKIRNRRNLCLYQPPVILSVLPLSMLHPPTFSIFSSSNSSPAPRLFFREEKSEQLLDTRQELENMEVELKRLQQEVMPPTCTQQHTNIHMTWSPLQLLLPPLSKYFASAALPGFNQLAGDLAH